VRRVNLPLRGFGRTHQRRNGRRSPGDHLRDCVKITGAHEALVLHRLVPVSKFAAELLFLQSGVGSHACEFVPSRQFEHAQVQCMESRECDELELVSQGIFCGCSSYMR